MSTTAQNLYGFASENARREFGNRRRRGPEDTHWSFYDSPYRALCGASIELDQFSKTPSCAACQAALRQMQAEDAR